MAFRLLLALAALAGLAAASSADWWKSAVYYQIYPRSFKDSDGDGVGDLNGITSKLEHLKDAGVDATWLSPIFKSPMADFGYDIADFYTIDPLFGSNDDFVALKARADELGIKVILDFVPNHSSNESEWFALSVQRVDPYTDYYVWEDGVPNADDPSRMDPPNNWISNFGGSAWAWHAGRGQFFLHQFGVGQPDLNYRSAALVEEMKSVLRFWLERGIDGFRVDAVPYLFEDASLADEPRSYDPSALPTEEKYLTHVYTQNQPETIDMVTQWRAVLDEYTAVDGVTRVMLAEVYAPLLTTFEYFGTEQKPGAHMPFNFQFISYLKNASSAQDIVHLVLQWQAGVPAWGSSNWVIGNHDNRRAASRYGRDAVDAINMLLQLLPGAAVTYNGEELGMEDGVISWAQSVDPMALNAGEERYMLFSRDPERTPFEWDGSKNAGFSDADSTWLPVNADYLSLNLAAEQAAPRSHYAVYRRLTAVRQLPAARQGALDIQALGDVVAFSRSLEGEATVVVLVNWGSAAAAVDASALTGVQGALTVLVASADAAYAEGDVVEATSISLGPKDGLVLTSA